MSDAVGELFEINEAPGTTINIPVAGNFVQWTTSVAGEGGPSDIVEVDAANDQLVVGAAGGGLYEVHAGMSLSGSANSLKQGAIFLNGVRQQKLEFNRQIGGGMDQGFVGISGLIRLVAADIVDLRFTADGNGDTVVLHHVDLFIHALIRDIA
jgi:hypothetical protein